MRALTLAGVHLRPGALFGSMIPKNGYRFSEKIMLQRKFTAA